MAAITSAADGTWIAGAATTWVGGIAPGEGDSAIIANTHDVELDGTVVVGPDSTTAAIEVQSGGRLFVPSTVAGSYTLTCKGDIKTDATGGTIEFGTVANPIPNTRTFNLKLNYSASLSDGEFGLLIRAGGTFTCQGADPWGNGLTDPDRTLLAADAAANATSITVAHTTLWKANDRITIAPTTRTYTQYDPTTTFAGQVSSAVGTTLNLTNFGGTGGGLLYAHSGTSPIQAEIINLTRNIVIENYDGGPGAPGNSAFVTFETTATIDCDWTEFRYCGTNAADKYGVVSIKTTSGSCNLNRCSFHDSEYYLIYSTATGNVSISNCIGAAATYHFRYPLASTNTFTNNWFTRATYGSSFLGSGSASYIRISGADSSFQHNSSSGNINLSYFNIHSTNGPVTLQSAPFTAIITNTSIRRCSAGIIATFGSLNMSDTSIIGNSSYNLTLAQVYDVLLDNVTLDGEASYSSPIGLSQTINGKIKIYNSSFGTTTGHTTSDIYLPTLNYYVDIQLFNTILGSTTDINTPTGYGSGIIRASKHNGTVGLAGEKTWKYGVACLLGKITADTSYYATASPSAKLTPSSATYKLESGSMFVPVGSGQNPTVTVKVRESNALNGNAPRLMVRRNDALGITADTVLDTATNGPDVDTPPGTWETLSGQPGAVSADGVLEFFVDVDGTAGYCGVCDWSVTGAKTQADNLDAYWSYGLPFDGLLTAAAAGGGGNSVIGSGVIIKGR